MLLNKKIVFISLLVLFISFINLYAFEQTLTPNENITVGDKVVFNIKANGLTIDSVDKKKLLQANFGDFELLDVKSAQDGSLDLVLSVYKAGKTELLSVEIPYVYNDQQKFVKTNAMPIEIKSVLNPQKPSTDIYDIKNLIKFNHGILYYLYFVSAIILIALVICFIYKFIRNKKRKPTREEIISSIPPKEYALKQLDELIALNLIEKGFIKEYYDKLSDIIRFYISRTYNVETMEKTTSEIYLMLKDKIPAEYNRELKNYLLNCDFVKFAKLVPEDEEIKKDFGTAKGFIEKL